MPSRKQEKSSSGRAPGRGSMTARIALLRGINVGGHAQVTMTDLRDLFAGLGFAAVRTLLQTGNVVFSGGARTDAELERVLERELVTQLEVPADVFVRTAAEWAKIVAGNPFPADAERDPSHLVVVVLKIAPRAADVDALRAAVTGPEEIVAVGRALYVTYPAGIGRSRLTNVLIEKKLGTRGTARNWNTVRRLHELAGR